MVKEPLKYVTARPSLENPKRWYWQRPPHKLVRLPDDKVARYAMVERLNREAEGAQSAEGSTTWIVQKYRESDGYRDLAEGTKKYYKRILLDIETIAPTVQFVEGFSRRAVIEFIDTYSVGLRKQAGAVLRNLFNLAIYHGHGVSNQARDLRLRGGAPRKQTFSEADCKAWLLACGDDSTMKLAFTMLRYTVQRPNDVLCMTWAQYDGELIKLRQQKTKKLVDVPCHALLRAALEAAKANRRHTSIVANGLRNLSYARFSERFRKIADAAGLKGHQARDLRRTAAVMMAEAGATDVQIAAVAGWTIESTRQILETYLPRNTEMAREAVRRWEQKDTKV